MRLHEAYIMA